MEDFTRTACGDNVAPKKHKGKARSDDLDKDIRY